MVDGILARVDGHSDVEELARWSSAPVINSLSDRFHPSQIVADLLTLHEDLAGSLKGREYVAHQVSLDETLPGLNVAWVGDTCNVLYEMMVALPKVGMHLRAAVPKGYEFLPEVMKVASAEAKKAGTKLEFTNVPEEAVKGADLIVTDTWISMGQEAEKDRRLRDFVGYQVTMDLARRGGANPNWRFMHCLPRKSNEVDDEVFYSDRSIVFPVAENRKWSMLAIFEAAMVNKGY